ncbi:helix-turn-helix domain-containing protein, partial [Streptomyces globosus]|uniref:helix-turn-helix domain-containing protein n=2 Tax=Streptomyces TaxID=1883 RepID=UPI00380F0AA1
DTLPDKPADQLNLADKVHIVMALLTDDTDTRKKDIAHQYDIPVQQLDTWKKHYLEGNWTALMNGTNPFCP